LWAALARPRKKDRTSGGTKAPYHQCYGLAKRSGNQPPHKDHLRDLLVHSASSQVVEKNTTPVCKNRQEVLEPGGDAAAPPQARR